MLVNKAETTLNGVYLLPLLVGYLLLLLWIAVRAENKTAKPQSRRARAATHALSLSVLGAGWGYYGAVMGASWGDYGLRGQDAGTVWLYLSNFTGPILLVTLFFPIYKRIAVAAKRENAGSLGDFLSARYGKDRRIAALAAVVAMIGALPYIAEQLHTIAGTWAVMTQTPGGPPIARPLIVVALAASAIVLGARSPTLTRHNRGLLRMVAIESVIKLAALLVVAILGVWLMMRAGQPAVFRVAAEIGPPKLDLGFLTATVQSIAFALTWPRMFHVAFVELEDVDDIKTARWLFPLYWGLWAVAIAAIAFAGFVVMPGWTGHGSIVLALPMTQGQPIITAFAFIGGFSTCTAMVLVETVALSAMVSNDLLLPSIARLRPMGGASADRSRTIVNVRRATIVGILLLAWLYVVILDREGRFDDYNFRSYVAAAQLAPALVGAVIWRRGHRRGAVWGIVVGIAGWLLLVVAPRVVSNIDPALGASLEHGPFAGILFDRGTIICLAANVCVYVAVSLKSQPGLIDRVQAATFVSRSPVPSSGARPMHSTVGELRKLVEQFLGKEDAFRAFDELERSQTRRLSDDEPASPAVARAAERMLAGAIGVSSARNLIGLALAGAGQNASEINRMLDEAAQAVHFSRELLQTSLDSLDQGVSVVDSDIRLIAWNARYAELFGYAPDDLYVGRPLEQLIRSSGARGNTVIAEALIQERIGPIYRREPQHFERDLPNGMTLRVVGTPVASGEYVTSFTDVTQLRASTRALSLANEQLEQRVEARTQELTEANTELHAAKGLAERATNSQARFVAAASHDLLQPLHAARLFLGAAAEDLESREATRDLVQKADVSIEAADRLLKALLNLSRLEVDGVKPEFSAVDLNSLLSDLRRDFETSARDKGLDLLVLPTSVWVQSDPDLLRSVLQNLIGNAVRYTPSGGRVVVGCRRREGQGRVEVWDNGPGIAKHDLPRIFEEFYRVGGEAHAGGAGLGLAIADRICVALGHRLEVRAEQAMGSMFSVSATRCEPRRPDARIARGHALSRPLHVLLVEDEPSVLESTASLLRRWGVSVDAAAGARAARELAGPWDVILADYQLGPGETGLDLLLSMRERAGQRALITAHSAEGLIEMAAAEGVEVIRKPVAPASLRAFLTRASAVV